MRYNWQAKNWPEFRYDLEGMTERFLLYSEKQGRIKGVFSTLTEATRTSILEEVVVSEAIKTSEIEGEHLDRHSVRSSVRNKLGLSAKVVKDKQAENIATLVIDARQSYADPLREKQILGWHSILFEGHSSLTPLSIGQWRTHSEPMQIVSGPISKPKVHYEAPPSKQVKKEMEAFIRWFNESGPDAKHTIKFEPVRSAVAHLYFESIHPFEDGNGRIGRLLSEKVLSQGAGYPIYFSLSRCIEKKKKHYYSALEKAQYSLDISPWIEFFTDIILQAQTDTEREIDFILKKNKFLSEYSEMLSQRQLKVVRKMLDVGPEGFEGGMTAKKYMRLTKASKATATRDLQALLELGLLKQQGSGRNTAYQLKI